MDTTRARAHRRIHYPLAERPRLVVSDHIREVIDVAEYGLRFNLGGRDRVDVGRRLAGTLEIGDRHSVGVDGEIIWTDAETAAVKFTSPIPLRVILDEQLYLRARYKLRDL